MLTHHQLPTKIKQRSLVNLAISTCLCEMQTITPLSLYTQYAYIQQFYKKKKEKERKENLMQNTTLIKKALIFLNL